MMVSPDFDYVMELLESGEYVGFCEDCGHEQSGVEHDAREYTCAECGEPRVFGLFRWIGV